MELTERETKAFRAYNYDDVIMYLRRAGICAKRWYIAETGDMVVTFFNRLYKKDLLELANAIPNNFAVADSYTDRETDTTVTGLQIRFYPSPKTSSRTIKEIQQL